MNRPATPRPEAGPTNEPGERLFVACDGGPCISRLVSDPPPLEIADTGGLYVLNDDGSRDDWVYVWIPADV